MKTAIATHSTVKKVVMSYAGLRGSRYKIFKAYLIVLRSCKYIFGLQLRLLWAVNPNYGSGFGSNSYTNSVVEQEPRAKSQ
jgi:hypothetical protein